MLLDDLLTAIDIVEYQNKIELGTMIKGIAYNSKRVKEGYLFVAIEGFKNDGHKYIDNAIKNGAVAIVVERNLAKDYNLPLIKTSDSRLALAMLSKKFHDNSDEELSLIGITGTNGKTTTAFLLERTLNKLECKTGLVSTEENKIGAKKIPAKLTTSESLELHKFLQEMLAQKVDFAILEVSSHSLKLNRVAGVDFNRQIFTNFSAEHLGFHDDLADYFAAKAKLFEENKNPAIINLDDNYAKKIMQKAAGEVITYGLNPKADFKAERVKNSLEGVSYCLKTASGSYKVSLNLIGEFNVYNSLAAIATLASFDLDLADIIAAINQVEAISGRCQIIKENPLVILDGAHNPQGIINIKQALAALEFNNVFVLLSIYQDKDSAVMLKEIASFADEIIISENSKPRAAKADLLAEEIEEYSNDYLVIKDLAEAINYTFQQAKENDLILITGSLQTVREANKLI